MKNKIYLAGPMTGLPDLNYPAFHWAAAQLRALGHEVLNPAENPVPPCGSWQGYMRLALAQLVQCECIALLPGWAESKGALIERKLAQVLGMHIVLYCDLNTHGVSPHALEVALGIEEQVGNEPVPAFFWSSL